MTSINRHRSESQPEKYTTGWLGSLAYTGMSKIILRYPTWQRKPISVANLLIDGRPLGSVDVSSLASIGSDKYGSPLPYGYQLDTQSPGFKQAVCNIANSIYFGNAVNYTAALGPILTFVEKGGGSYFGDVVGSGYPGLKGKSPIVNPMLSVKKQWTYGTLGSDDSVLSDATPTPAPATNINYYGYFDCEVYCTYSVKAGGTLGVSMEVHTSIAQMIDSERDEILKELSLGNALTEAWYETISGQGAKMWTTYFESPSTARYLWDLVMRAAKVIGRFRSGKFLSDTISPTSPLGDAAKAHLEFRYALMPLIYESRDYARAFNTLNRKLPPFLSGYKKVDPIKRITDVSRDFTYGTDVVRLTGKLATFASGRATTYGIVSSSHGKAADSAFFTSGVFSAAWEIIPWSFIFDWFVNIQGLLGVLDQPFWLSQGPYASTSVVTTEFVGTLTVVTGPSAGKKVDVRHSRQTKERTVGDGFRGLESLIPFAGSGFNPVRLVDAMAIAVGFSGASTATKKKIR